MIPGLTISTDSGMPHSRNPSMTGKRRSGLGAGARRFGTQVEKIRPLLGHAQAMGDGFERLTTQAIAGKGIVG